MADRNKEKNIDPNTGKQIRQRLSIEEVDVEIAKRMRAYAILEDRSLSSVINEAMIMWLEQRKNKFKL